MTPGLLSYIVSARLIVHLSEAGLVITRANAAGNKNMEPPGAIPSNGRLFRRASSWHSLSGFFSTASFQRKRERPFCPGKWRAPLKCLFERKNKGEAAFLCRSLPNKRIIPSVSPSELRITHRYPRKSPADTLLILSAIVILYSFWCVTVIMNRRSARNKASE